MLVININKKKINRDKDRVAGDSTFGRMVRKGLLEVKGLTRDGIEVQASHVTIWHKIIPSQEQKMSTNI